jgi:hypothetical protein
MRCCLDDERRKKCTTCKRRRVKQKAKSPRGREGGWEGGREGGRAGDLGVGELEEREAGREKPQNCYKSPESAIDFAITRPGKLLTFLPTTQAS